MAERHCDLTAVLRDDVYGDIKLVEFLAVEVCDKKYISGLIRQLNEHYPIPEFSHLKRVKTGKDICPQVLIKPKGTADQRLNDLEHELTTTIDTTGLGKLSVVWVSKVKPITRHHYEIASTYWPTQFHENRRLEKALKGELFSSEEILQFESLMGAALAASGHEDEIEGAVITDPLTNSVVARGRTDPAHPLKHAVMVAIDNVAIQQGGGAWNKGGRPSLLQQHPLKEASPCSLTAISSSEIKCLDSTVSLTTPSLTTPSLQSADGTSSASTQERYSQAEPNVSAPLTSKGVKSACSNALCDLPPTKRSKVTTQYLCTGYDLFTTKEPCVMCSMALVHSRIGRVFYGKPDKEVGGLGSKYKIHLQDGLNHHFEVYCGLLKYR